MTGADDSDVCGEEGTEESDVELVRAYESGATITELAARFGMTYYGTRTALLAAGVTLRQAGPTGAPAPPGLIEAYLAGASIQDLATRFGLSFGVVRRMLLQGGVRLRPQGGVPRGDVTGGST
ncbi:helix-turn-helix domain-containing protein [Amycolatopsis thailandensis]|uniref:helix-turn-helix domain-containing protein n=1 Tax=Amycolatopsis thailandensis TaxID=589330 RepID=UPI00364AACC9